MSVPTRRDDLAGVGPGDGGGRATPAEGVESAGFTAHATAQHSGAAINLRRHFWHASLRLLVLLAADLGSFLLLRTALRIIRQSVWVGDRPAALVNWLFRAGYLSGWQLGVALVLGLAVAGTYGPGDRRRDARRLFLACALATALPLWASLGHESFTLTLTRYVLTALPLWAFLLVVRYAIDRLLRRYAPHQPASARARTVLVGHAGDCIDMRGRRGLTEQGGFRVLGFVDTHAHASGALGHVGDLEHILEEHRVDTIVVCGYTDDVTMAKIVRAAALEECQVLLVARRFELAGVYPALIHRRGQPFIALRSVALRGQQLVLKRLLDVVGSLLVGLILSPLMLLIAIAVRMESPGPAIFSQRRLGRRGREFRCYKFRSMFAGAEQRLRADPEMYRQYQENDYKLPAALDLRVTRVGRVLRRTSLDELPQLWNVLRGDMSLVGPRPIVPEEIRHYNGEAPLLLSLKPGITGAWQVNGRSTCQYPERAAVELEYVEGWSLLRDIVILLRTVPIVISRRGSY